MLVRLSDFAIKKIDCLMIIQVLILVVLFCCSYTCFLFFVLLHPSSVLHSVTLLRQQCPTVFLSLFTRPHYTLLSDKDVVRLESNSAY
jgi:hypothetical protein